MDATNDGPRERLLNTLDLLNQTQNVLDVGINQLLGEADVAKASLYSHFGSKEALIAAWLDKRQGEWFGWFDAYLESRGDSCDAREELDHAFGFLESWLTRDDFAGCPFVTVYLQLRDPEHPVAERSKRYAARLHRFFLERLKALSVRRADQVATALLQLFLGAIVTQQLGTGSDAARAARSSAKLLVTAALA